MLGLALAIGGAVAAETLVAMVAGATGTSSPYIPVSGWIALIAGPALLAAAETLMPIVQLLRTEPTQSIGATE